MPVLLHVGFEHPHLFWIVVVGIAAFAAGLGVNLARSTADESGREARIDDSPDQ